MASLRASKTDPFQQGCSLLVGRVNNSNAPLCAVRPIEAYQRASAPTMAGTNHPFFKHKNGKVLSRAHLRSVVQRLLERDGCPYAAAFKGHSFRSEAATMAAKAGVPDWLIKTMGQWASDVYLTDIKTPQTTNATQTTGPFRCVCWPFGTYPLRRMIATSRPRQSRGSLSCCRG